MSSWTAAGDHGRVPVTHGLRFPYGNSWAVEGPAGSPSITAWSPIIRDVSDPVIIQLKQGKDHRLYPAQMPPPKAWRWQVVTLTHQLAHEQGLSERAAQRELLARGYRRSLGTIHGDLTRPMPTCERCRETVDHD